MQVSQQICSFLTTGPAIAAHFSATGLHPHYRAIQQLLTLQQLSPGDPLHMPIPIARRDSERFYAFWNRNKPDLEAVYNAQVERVDGPVTLRIYLSLPWINSLRRSSIAARLPTTHLTITQSPKIVEYQNVLAHDPLPSHPRRRRVQDQFLSSISPWTK